MIKVLMIKKIDLNTQRYLSLNLVPTKKERIAEKAE
jgi:hypothetical protein